MRSIEVSRASIISGLFRGGRVKRITILFVGLFCNVCCAQDGADSASLRQRFQQPAGDARPMMRWWWFGPAVTPVELDREIAAMKAGGFGGFEVQPVRLVRTTDSVK
jgi:hypothetical protein